MRLELRFLYQDREIAAETAARHLTISFNENSSFKKIKARVAQEIELDRDAFDLFFESEQIDLSLQLKDSDLTADSVIDVVESDEYAMYVALKDKNFRGDFQEFKESQVCEIKKELDEIWETSAPDFLKEYTENPNSVFDLRKLIVTLRVEDEYMSKDVIDFSSRVEQEYMSKDVVIELTDAEFEASEKYEIMTNLILGLFPEARDWNDELEYAITFDPEKFFLIPQEEKVEYTEILSMIEYLRQQEWKTVYSDYIVTIKAFEKSILGICKQGDYTVFLQHSDRYIFASQYCHESALFYNGYQEKNHDDGFLSSYTGKYPVLETDPFSIFEGACNPFYVQPDMLPNPLYKALSRHDLVEAQHHVQSSQDPMREVDPDGNEFLFVWEISMRLKDFEMTKMLLENTRIDSLIEHPSRVDRLLSAVKEYSNKDILKLVVDTILNVHQRKILEDQDNECIYISKKRVGSETDTDKLFEIIKTHNDEINDKLAEWNS